jgi:15-cis-phytoene synthase
VDSTEQNTGPDRVLFPTTFDECRRSTRTYAKSFYFASHLLPKEKRLASYAVYAFCRAADDTVDHSVHNHAGRREALLELRALLDGIYDGDPDALRRAGVFGETVRKYTIPKQHFDQLLDGVETDIHKTRFETWDEVRVYCYRVASVVGLIMSEIFGYSDPAALEYAADLGMAMQLTNMLRDVPDDFRMGRIYLPLDEMRAFGYAEDDIGNGTMDARFVELMKRQVARAREYYARAGLGIRFLTDDGSRTTAALMSLIYAGILDDIEKHGFDVYSSRRHVPFFRKIGILLSYFVKRRRSRNTGGRKRIMNRIKPATR